MRKSWAIESAAQNLQRVASESPGNATARLHEAVAQAPDCLPRDESSQQQSAMNTGIVKFYDGPKGFGFIQRTDGGKDVFLHCSALHRAGLDGLAAGRKLKFDIERDSKGWDSATNLQLI